MLNLKKSGKIVWFEFSKMTLYIACMCAGLMSFNPFFGLCFFVFLYKLFLKIEQKKVIDDS